MKKLSKLHALFQNLHFFIQENALRVCSAGAILSKEKMNEHNIATNLL